MFISPWTHALAALLLQGSGATAPAPAAPPNIVVIVADDLGWKDVGYHGSEIRTPNIDQLAATGARLEQFYAQPMCTPTRAALLTGRYPFRYGLQTIVIPAPSTFGLAVDEWLLPQALGDAGYATRMVGKWHLGHGDRAYWPNHRGFDSHYGPLIGEIDYFTHKEHDTVDWYRDGKVVIEEGYSTTLLGDDAVKVIRNHDRSKPLFLYLAFNAPHSPYQAPKEYVDRHPEIAEPTRRTYAGMISALDDQIGRVVQALDETGMRSNTLILFQSDNGGTFNPMFAGSIADMSKVVVPCDNGPFRDGKGSLYEGAVRVAALANWPGRIPAGVTIDEVIHVTDLYPTLVSLAGGTLGKNKPLDGVDVWPVISQGKPSPRSEVVVNIEPFRAAIRQGRWKLVWKALIPSTVELYDLSTDPAEKSNVAAQHPEVVAGLQKRVNELAAAGVNPLILQTEFKAMRERLSMPPAIAGQELDLSQEH